MLLVLKRRLLLLLLIWKHCSLVLVHPSSGTTHGNDVRRGRTWSNDNSNVLKVRRLLWTVNDVHRVLVGVCDGPRGKKRTRVFIFALRWWRPQERGHQAKSVVSRIDLDDFPSYLVHVHRRVAVRHGRSEVQVWLQKEFIVKIFLFFDIRSSTALATLHLHI